MVSDRPVLPYKSVVLTNHPTVSLMEIVKEFLCREKGAPNRREENLDREVESVTHATSRAVFRFNDEDRDDWSRPSVAMQKTTTNIPSYVRFLPPGENPLHVTTLPAGTCSYCCPIDVDQDIEYLLFTRCVGN